MGFILICNNFFYGIKDLVPETWFIWHQIDICFMCFKDLFILHWVEWKFSFLVHCFMYVLLLNLFVSKYWNLHAMMWYLLLAFVGQFNGSYCLIYSRGIFYYHGITLILAWISNHMHYKVWDEIYLSMLKLALLRFWQWICNFIPHFTQHLITCPCWESS